MSQFVFVFVWLSPLVASSLPSSRVVVLLFFVDLEWAWHCDESKRDPVVLVVGCAWTLLHGFHMFFH
jgi:hypothetical protein